MKKWMTRFYTGLGLFFVGLAILGAVLPILPTTPFLLLALWFFTGSSERLRNWLLTNRIFGKYLSDYKCGRGVSLNSKIYILALLWGTITYSAIWAVDIFWVKVMLFAIAGGVTVHILHIRTKPRRRRIVVLVPTEGEGKYFADVLPVLGVRGGWSNRTGRSDMPGGRDFYAASDKHGFSAAYGRHGRRVRECLSYDIEVCVCGVGMAATAGATARVLADRPDAIILSGIAGAYPGSRVGIGECVLVASERVADQGAFRDGAFVPLYQRDFVCPYVADIKSMRSVAGYTVNAAAGKFFYIHGVDGITAGTLCPPVTEEWRAGAEGVSCSDEGVAASSVAGTIPSGTGLFPEPAEIENMEGAAFFAVCEGGGVPYFEVRAVSNMTTDPREAWKLDEACMALAEGIKKLTDEIKS